MNNSLREHLNNSIKTENVNESLVLSAIVCATCIGYAAGPILNTDFMKSVGSGIGSLLSGIGSLFGLGKKKEEEKEKKEDKKKKEEEDEIATLKGILKKDPDDMTGKEKEMLEKAANNPRLQKEFSNNELKKLNKAIGVSSSDDDDESMPEGDEKKLHDILKKKPEDMTPKDKKMLKSFNDKYDLSDYLSKGELDKMSAAGISVGSNKDDNNDIDDDEVEEYVKTGEWNATLLKIAAKANEEEKDPEKKKKMDAMLDVAIASTYDENGNVLPLEEQRKKMKETVGEENWEAFSKDLDTYVNEADKADTEKFIKDVNSSYFRLSEEEHDKIDENQKKRAKEASERIAKEKAEQQKIDDEIADLQKQIEEKSKDSVMKDDANPEIKELEKKIKETQDKKVELVNNSTLGAASPTTAKNINDRDKENNGVDVTAKPKKDDKTESEPKKDDTGNDDPKKDDKTESEPKKDDTGNDDPKKDDKTESEPKKDDKGDDETKKKLDDAEAKWKEREADFEKKWEKKLEDAESEADKEKVMAEYDKAKKRLKAAKHKDLDSIDDADDHDTENDATKKGKYKVKEEEVTDPKTGEKKKVTTYTGPRGGKFYYPDGKSKKPENKVYVHESVTYRITPFNRLRRYLLEKLNLI